MTQSLEMTRDYSRLVVYQTGTSPADFAWEKPQKLLPFVQRGRILLRCGSAFALSLPSLGVSSLDLGRLFTQAALFSFEHYFPSVIPGCPNDQTSDVQLHIGESGDYSRGIPGSHLRCAPE